MYALCKALFLYALSIKLNLFPNLKRLILKMTVLLGWHKRDERRSYSTFKVRRGGREEIPLVQGQGQQLCFAGAAVKRYTTSKVRETQVRW